MVDKDSHLAVTNVDGVNVVQFADRKILDELSIAQIQSELSRLVAEMKDVKLLLCFRNVEHLSSAALGTLITVHKQVEEKKGKLKLSDIAPPIYEVFKITRLNKLFKIHSTMQEALDAF